MTRLTSLTNAQTSLIFDFDGVLVDSEAIAVAVEEELWTKAGFAVSATEIAERFIGLSYETIVSQLETQFGRSIPEGLMDEVQGETLARFPDELTEVAGMSDVLDSNRLPRSVASSSPLQRIHLSLEITGLTPRFDADLVFSGDMVENGKPAPDLFLFAADKMGAEPKNCVVIEDSPHGVTAGVAAGMTVIGLIAASHATPALGTRLLDAGATTVVSSTAELAELINPGS